MHLINDEQFDFLKMLIQVDIIVSKRALDMMLTDASSPSPVGLRVTTSHFSGVVTMIWVSAISALVSCISPKHAEGNQ